VVLTEGCVDPFSPKVVRASMGGVFSLPISMGKKVLELVDVFRRRGVPVYLLDSAPGGESLYPPPADRRPAFVVGGETEGLSPEWRCGLEKVVRIPQMPRIDSLNAGVASAVVLARWWEQVCPTA
jgi:TrmH family RNA methyltransferase